MIIKKIQVYESEDLPKLVRLLISFGTEFPNESASMRWANDFFAELVLCNQHDIAVLTELFTFLGLFPTVTTAVGAVDVAQRVITCFHCAIKHETTNKSESPEFQILKKAVDDYIESVHLDIIARPSLTTADFLTPYTAALRFFFSQAQSADSIWNVCREAFPLAPLECSKFLQSWHTKISNSQAFISDAHSLLKFVTSPEVFVAWSQITKASDSANIDQTTSVVKQVVTALVEENNELKPSWRTVFADFLGIAPPAPIAPSLDQPFRKLQFVLAEGDVKQSLRDAYISDNIMDLRTAIRHFRDTIAIDSFDTAPIRVHRDIIRFFLSTNLEPFPLPIALTYLRGPWRQLALARIATNPSRFIQGLIHGRKLHKTDLLAFSSSIGFVQYPKNELIAFVTKLFYDSEKRPRIRMALRVLNVALKATGEVSDSLATDLIASFLQRKATTSLMEISLIMRTMAEFMKSPQTLLKYLKTMLETFRGCPSLQGNFHIVHLRFFACLPDETMPGYYAQAEELTIAEYLKANRPSRFLSGLRQVQMALVSMNDLRSFRIMQTLSEKVVKKFTAFQRINWAFGWQIQIINRWLIQPVYRSFHQFICDQLMSTLTTSPAVPYFCDYLGWIPTAIQSGVSVKELMGRLDLLSQVRSPSIFRLALAILREQLRANAARRDTLAIDSCLTFLTDHSRNQSYYSIDYLRAFVGMLADVHRDAMFHFCMNAAKTIRFLPVFLAVCDAIKRAHDPDFSAFLVTAMIQLTDSEDHRRALEIARDGPLTREALTLAAIDRTTAPLP
jgi:hypothetical protein